jgi:hypothetical protein
MNVRRLITTLREQRAEAVRPDSAIAADLK